MGDANKEDELREEIRSIKERIRALEKEHRILCEDIISGDAQTRMKRRYLRNDNEFKNKKEKIDEQIKIEI